MKDEFFVSFVFTIISQISNLWITIYWRMIFFVSIQYLKKKRLKLRLLANGHLQHGIHFRRLCMLQCRFDRRHRQMSMNRVWQGIGLLVLNAIHRLHQLGCYCWWHICNKIKSIQIDFISYELHSILIWFLCTQYWILHWFKLLWKTEYLLS